MKPKDAEALKKNLTRRLSYVVQEKGKWRELYAYALTHRAKDDELPIDRMDMDMSYINYRKCAAEIEFLKGEIELLNRVLTKS